MNNNNNNNTIDDGANEALKSKIDIDVLMKSERMQKIQWTHNANMDIYARLLEKVRVGYGKNILVKNPYISLIPAVICILIVFISALLVDTIPRLYVIRYIFWVCFISALPLMILCTFLQKRYEWISNNIENIGTLKENEEKVYDLICCIEQLNILSQKQHGVYMMTYDDVRKMIEAKEFNIFLIVYEKLLKEISDWNYVAELRDIVILSYCDSVVVQTSFSIDISISL